MIFPCCKDSLVHKHQNGQSFLNSDLLTAGWGESGKVQKCCFSRGSFYQQYHHINSQSLESQSIHHCPLTATIHSFTVFPLFNNRLKIGVGFPGSSVVKNLPAVQETQVQSLDWEDPLEKDMATHSSILAREIPWMVEPVGYSPWGSQQRQLNNKDWCKNDVLKRSKRGLCASEKLHSSSLPGFLAQTRLAM